MLKPALKEKVLNAQRNELTEYIIYKKLALVIKDKDNQQVLKNISQDELAHHDFWKSLTEESVTADKVKIFFYITITRLFGLTFGIKLMEQGEGLAQEAYLALKEISPRVEEIIQEENTHENALIGLINEERLQYASSMVLGLNDALVELSGALVGFTLALQNTRLVAIVGLITGIAASLSMAASEYLSTKQENTSKNPLKASLYTGLAYVGTVVILVAPYFLLKNIFFCLSLVIMDALLIILIFTFYISVAKGLSFKKKFLEMAGISLGIAAINFLIGLMIRKVFGIDV